MMSSNGKPAIALVDDDYHSARLMTRMLEAHGSPAISRLADPDTAIDALVGIAAAQVDPSQYLAVIDLKATSSATREFVRRLKERAPGLTIVAMAPSLDREVREDLLAAGAAAVFERHADIAAYRREAASIVNFWARNQQRLDPTGT